MNSIIIRPISETTSCDDDIEELKKLIEKVVDKVDQKLNTVFEVVTEDRCEHELKIVDTVPYQNNFQDPEIETRVSCDTCNEEFDLSIKFSDFKELLDSFVNT